MYSWDFFIAHAGADKAIAENLYKLLAPHSRVFLDSVSLAPGDEWGRSLVQAQQQSRITVVLISSESEKAYYQREEIAAAISMSRLESTGHLVVPVFLDAGARDNKNIPYGLRVIHGLHVADPNDLSETAKNLLKLLTDEKDSQTIEKKQEAAQVFSDRKVMRSWSPFKGTVVEAEFRLNSKHTIKYEREEALVASIVHLYVDGNEIFHRKIGFLDFTSISQPFKLESIDCLFTCKTGLGTLWVHVYVGGEELFKV